MLFQTSECNDYKAIDRGTIRVPQLKKINYVVGGCNPNLERFGDFNGGCLDTNSGITWSSVSNGYWNYEGAVNYCHNLSENQTRGWSLPSVYDVSQLSGSDSAIRGFKDSSLIDDWFWVDDGTADKKPIRVNVALGISNANQNPEMRFKVICRQ